MGAIKEKPIPFRDDMIHATLSGTKTQTRRVVTGAPSLVHWNPIVVAGRAGWEDGHGAPLNCPYGQLGDRLWVREAWMPDAPRDGTWPDVQFYGCKDSSLDLIPERYRKPKHCLFRATWDGHELVGWKPSIHMPRWACRILLQIANIRVERLQDISEADAVAEGGPVDHPNGTARGWFEQLWEKLNGAGSWDANPWVWVIEFKKVEA